MANVRRKHAAEPMSLHCATADVTTVAVTYVFDEF